MRPALAQLDVPTLLAALDAARASDVDPKLIMKAEQRLGQAQKRKASLEGTCVIENQTTFLDQLDPRGVRLVNIEHPTDQPVAPADPMGQASGSSQIAPVEPRDVEIGVIGVGQPHQRPPLFRDDESRLQRGIKGVCYLLCCPFVSLYIGAK